MSQCLALDMPQQHKDPISARKCCHTQQCLNFYNCVVDELAGQGQVNGDTPIRLQGGPRLTRDGLKLVLVSSMPFKEPVLCCLFERAAASMRYRSNDRTISRRVIFLARHHLAPDSCSGVFSFLLNLRLGLITLLI